MSLSALAVAIMGPPMGAVADQTGRRKPWLAAFTLIAAFGAMMLWSVEPDTRFVVRALFWVALANFAFEMGMVFYNAMLPDLAPPDSIGRWSGWGWGLGYGGGLSCLALILFTLIRTDSPWFGLQKEAAEHVRAAGPLVAVWMIVFAAPLFLWTPDRGRTGQTIPAAVRNGLASLWQTLRQLGQYRPITRFLIARMVYTDGLNTLFAFGGIYAAGSFGMDDGDVILFAIAINVAAGVGAATFAWVDDRVGPKPTIVIAITGLAILGSVLVVVDGATLFWVFGVPLGLFVGPAQAASRSMMARLAPADMRTEFFGLYALSGKATAFVGPALLAWTTMAFDSQRVGMATIIVFFLAGLALLSRVVVSPGN